MKTLNSQRLKTHRYAVVLSFTICISVKPICAGDQADLESQLHQRADAAVGNSPRFCVAIGFVDGDKTYVVFSGHRSFGGAAPMKTPSLKLAPSPKRTPLSCLPMLSTEEK